MTNEGKLGINGRETMYLYVLWSSASVIFGCHWFSSFLSKLDIETDTTTWADPDMTNCNPVVTILELNNITVTTGKRTGQTNSYK